jgi:hypothetical protein
MISDAEILEVTREVFVHFGGGALAYAETRLAQHRLGEDDLGVTIWEGVVAALHQIDQNRGTQ